MSGAAKATINHDFMRKWAEERGGKPAAVKARRREGDPGILRIDFPGWSGEETLEEIPWDEWFDAFEANNLAFLYQDTIDHQVSRFSKLVDRDSVELDERGFGTPKKKHASEHKKESGTRTQAGAGGAEGPQEGQEREMGEEAEAEEAADGEELEIEIEELEPESYEEEDVTEASAEEETEAEAQEAEGAGAQEAEEAPRSGPRAAQAARSKRRAG